VLLELTDGVSSTAVWGAEQENTNNNGNNKDDELKKIFIIGSLLTSWERKYGLTTLR